MKRLLPLLGALLISPLLFGHSMPTITIEKPDVPYVDFNAKISAYGSGPADVPVETIGRKDGPAGPSRGRHTPAKSEAEYQFNEQAPPNNTKTFRTYVDCNGQDGYLTSQVDPNGHVVSARFSPKFDPADPKGLNGSAVKPSFVGPDGMSGTLNQQQQIAMTKGQLSGSLGGLNCGKANADPSAGGCAA